MRTLKVWVGPIAGLVVVAALVFLLKGGPKPATPAPTLSATAFVMSVDPTTVTQINIASGGKTMTLLAKAGATNAWTIDSATGKAADPTKVQNMLSLLDPLQASRDLGTVTSPKDYGLATPTTILKVTLKSGTVDSLDVGAQTPVGGYYASTASGGKVFIIDNSVEQALVTDPAQWVPVATSTATSTGG